MCKRSEIIFQTVRASRYDYLKTSKYSLLKIMLQIDGCENFIRIYGGFMVYKKLPIKGWDAKVFLFLMKFPLPAPLADTF